MEDEKIEQRSEMIKNTELQKEIKNINDSKIDKLLNDAQLLLGLQG